MYAENLISKFARIDARVKIAESTRRLLPGARAVALDVLSDRHGEFFDITCRGGDGVELVVMDVQPAGRHLLLLVRDNGEKQKFLCGHDERHWFVAAIPEAAPVGTVRQAMEALKPGEVAEQQSRLGVSGRKRNRRKNAAFVRQGEWFFVPVSDLVVDASRVRRGEVLRRGASKPHVAEFGFRTGGETVYVCSRRPNGVTEDAYHRIISRDPAAKQWGWQTMRRNMSVYVRGRVRHPDHRTVTLHGWHRVLLNTESQARAMRNVAFLD